MADVLQPGHRQVAAGYVIYGSSTMLVYTTGQGVHGFTLDPTIGEFLLSHPSIRTPAVGKYYSVNESNFARWSRGVQTAVRGFHGDRPNGSTGKNSRYIGSLVADFHRNLIAGGIFLYPGRHQEPEGQAAPALRVLARWRSSPSRPAARRPTACGRILDIVPRALHQRTPLVIGSRRDVEFVAETMLARSAGVSEPRAMIRRELRSRCTAPPTGPETPRATSARRAVPVHPRPPPRCTPSGSGPCASTPGSAPPRRPTPASATCWRRGRPGSPPRSTCRPRWGYDSDHPMAEGEVGRVGVAIDTVDDLATLFREIPLDQVSTSMTINATAAILLAMYVVVGEEQGVAAERR